jgi:hypothetical protein
VWRRLACLRDPLSSLLGRRRRSLFLQLQLKRVSLFQRK